MIKRFLLGVALSSSFSFSAFAYWDQEKTLENVIAAETEIRQLHFDQAAQILNRLTLKADPATKEFSQAQYLIGFIHVQKKEWKKAITALSLPYQDSHFKVLSAYCLGYSYYQLNDLEQAQHFLEEALHSDQADIVMSATYYLGMVKSAKKDLNSARVDFEKVVTNRATKEPILSYARGMLALLVRPREGDELNDVAEFPFGANSYTLSPRLLLPPGTKKFGGTVSLSLPVIDTNAVAPPGSIRPDLDRGGVGTAIGLNLWARLRQTNHGDFGASYLFRTNYLFSALDTSYGRTYDLWSHTLALPYTINSGTVGSSLKQFRLTPGATLLESTVGGTNGIPPASIYESYFLKADFLEASTALTHEEYNLALRYDHSKFPGPDSQNATGPAFTAGFLNTYRLNFEKNREWYYGANVEGIASKGKEYRQTGAYAKLGMMFPVERPELTLRMQVMGGLDYFLYSLGNRFDKLIRYDISGTARLSENLNFVQTVGVLKQFSNDPIGDYARLTLSSTFSFNF